MLGLSRLTTIVEDLMFLRMQGPLAQQCSVTCRIAEDQCSQLLLKIFKTHRSNYVSSYTVCRLLMVGEEDHASFGRVKNFED